MNQDTFAPFVPPTSSPIPPDTNSAKKSRKKKAAAVNLPTPPVHAKKPRKKRAVGKNPALAAPYTAPAKKARKVRTTIMSVRKGKVVGKVRALKLDMYTAMAISATLKPTDFKTFEAITESLQAINKATRTRVLVAIQKVFG